MFGECSGNTVERKLIFPSAIVDARDRTGDWEGDTVIGKGHQGALVTVVERASLFTVIRSVMRKTALAVTNAMTSGLEPYSGQGVNHDLEQW